MKKHILVSILLVSIFTGISGCGPTLEERQKRAETQYELGWAEFYQGDFEQLYKQIMPRWLCKIISWRRTRFMD